MTAGDDRFFELASCLPDFVVLVDRDLRYRWVNRAAEGLTLEEIYSSAMEDFNAPEDWPMIRDTVMRCFDTGEEGSYVSQGYGDGLEISTYETRVIRGVPVDGDPRVILLVRDISAQAKAELALRQSEERFRAFMLSSPQFVLVLNSDYKIVYVNRTAFGFTTDGLEGQSVASVMGATNRDQNLSIIKAAIEDKIVGAYETLHQDRYFSVRVVPMNGPDEIRALMIVEDITAERSATRALQQSQERLKRALSATRAGFYDINLKTGESEAWGDLKEQISVRSEEGQVRIDLDLIHPDDRSKVMQFSEQLSSADTKGAELDYRIRDADGNYRWVMDRASRISRDGDARIAGLLLDINDLQESERQRQELHQQLQQAQRLESIGLLAGGIAHDFNNLLLVIESGTILAKRRLGVNSAVHDDLQHVLDAAHRAGQLTGQLLAFSRRSPLCVEVLDLAATAKNVFAMVQRILPETITCSLYLPDRPVHVMADPQQLEQVLLNLCINARDAMPEGGILKLGLETSTDEATLSVSDSGSGISSADRERIFEPFFTTKGVGKGTGLGLAMVHGIVQQHSGRIEVVSEHHQGATFNVTLPLSNGEIAEHKVFTTIGQKGTGHILVAEDEPAVLRVLMRILTEAGYQVTAAHDGLEALSLFEPGLFDLLLLDVVMPGLDGWKTYERVRAIDPTVRVLFSSGYSADLMGDAADAPSMLRKPYEPDALLAAVATELARS